MLSIYIALAALASYWILQKLLKKDLLKSVPGPPTIPVLGNFLQLVPNKLHIQLLEWARSYGSVYKLVLAGTPVVVVSGTKAMHEVWKHNMPTVGVWFSNVWYVEWRTFDSRIWSYFTETTFGRYIHIVGFQTCLKMTLTEAVVWLWKVYNNYLYMTVCYKFTDISILYVN